MVDSKKHHYVPQVMLRQFVYRKKQIIVFDKHESRQYPSSIIDAASENHFNTIEHNGERINFESVFQECDDSFSGIQDKILNNGGTYNLGLEDRDRLLEILVVQLCRTKIYRSNFVSIASQLKERASELYGREVEVEIPSENDSRKIALSSLQDTSELKSAISGKVGFLIQANENERFFISDNPIVFHNTFPYGSLGLSSPGIEIYLPLSPSITLALYCPSMIKKLGLASSPESEMGLENKTIYQGIIDGVAAGTPVSLGETTTEFLNKLQVSQSTRFLYGSNQSDFDFVGDYLKANSNLIHVEAKTSLGQFGRVPHSRKMPEGDWIVFHTPEDHGMFQVHGVSTGKGFSIKTEYDGLVEHLLSSDIVKEVSLFRNGNESIHMKDVKIVRTGFSEGIISLTFKHRDEFLNRILERAAT